MKRMEPSHHSRRFLIEWLLLAAALGALGGFVGYSIFREHQRIETGERERLTTQAKVVHDNLERQLDSTNRALAEVRGQIPYWTGVADGQRIGAQHLKALSEAMPGVRTMTILNSKGMVINSDKKELIGKDFGQREYFVVPQNRPDPEVLYVSAPFKTTLGVFTINLARVVVGPNGRFDGIVTATLDPEEFKVLLSSVLYAPEMRATLIHGDGKVFMVVPDLENVAGKDLSSPGSFFARHMKSGQQTSVDVGIVRMTGDEAMSVLQTIQPAALAMDKPLVIGVGRGLKSIFATWRRDAYLQGSLFAVLALSSILGVFLYQGRQRRYDRLLASQEAERTQAELALKNSERLLRTALKAASLGNYSIDLETGLWESSDDLDKIFGIDANFKRDIPGWGSLLHPKFRSRILDEFEKTVRESKAFTREYRVIRPSDGKMRWVVMWGDFEYDKAGNPVRQVGTVQDITRRKQAEQQLRIAATAFEAQEGMVVTDTDNVILRVNRAFSEITGYSAKEAVGRTPSLLKSGRHDAAFYAEMWEDLRRLGTWQGEIWNRRKSGEVYPEWLTITAVSGDDDEVTHYVATLTDITQRKAAEDEIKNLAFYDPLTRLPNRRLLLDRLQQALASSARSKREGAIFFIDLDNFKTLNDTLGHDKGDLLLQQVAQRLTTCIREGDTVARLGGDEFVVMLEDLSANPKEAAAQTETVGEKILVTLNEIYHLAGHEHHSTPSIGITLFNDHLNSVDELLKRADLAMYQAKAEGRNTLRFYDPEMQALINSRVSLEADLRNGLQERQFVLYYQPQVREDGTILGAEALVRWNHPGRGLVPPAEFIPLAEETGLILPLGHWVLEAACTQLVAWTTNEKAAGLTLAVNVSARQFRQTDFVEQVLAVLAHTGADPHRLKIELTESLLLDDVEDIIAKMTALKAKGVGFSLDDFGTGYSSLAYLKRLPLDQLKIDQSFVRDVFTDINDAAIAQTIIALSQTMGLSVIAEGVETEEQRDFLSRQGCQTYQGYLFSRPLPLDGFEIFLEK